MYFTKLGLVFVSIVCLQSSVVVASENAEQTLQHPVHYNLTELIDKALESNNSEDQKSLKRALENSPFVFYETDVVLNNFLQLIPLLDLLTLLKPEGVPPQVILSLKYVNQTKATLLKSRMADVFYNTEPKFGFEVRRKFKKHIGAVTLDFYTPHRAENLPGSQYQKLYSFTYSVKTFLKEMLGVDVSVGIITKYGRDFQTEFLKRQAQYADFFVYSIDVSEFPMFPEDFFETIDNGLNHQRGQKNSYIGKAATNDLVILKVFNNPTTSEVHTLNYTYQSSGDYWTTFGRVIKATLNYTTISKNLLQRAYMRAQQIVNDVVQKWTTTKLENVVISNSNMVSKRTSGDKGKILIQHFLQLEEDDMTACNVRSILSTVQNHFATLTADEKTWKIITRIKQAITDDPINCGAYDELKIDRNVPQHVILKFTPRISSFWEDVEPYIMDLVYNHSSVGHFRVETLLFLDDDIKSSIEVQNFAKKAKENKFRLSCSVSFYKLRTFFEDFYYGKEITHETFRTTLETKLCQPLFSSIDTFVWQVDDTSMGYYPRQGLFSSYSDLFLGRESFLLSFLKRMCW